MRVKEYRLQWEMSQQDLAQATGLSIRQIRDIESGRVSPRMIRADTVLRLARSFGVSMEDIMGEFHETETGKLIYMSEFEWFTPKEP